MTVRLAVDALADWIEAQYATHLDAVSATLANVTHVRSWRPYDRRTPLLAVYATSAAPYDEAGQRNRSWSVSCEVRLDIVGSTDTDASQDDALAYHQALVTCIDAYNDTQATGHAFILGGWQSDDLASTDNQSRHTWAQTVEVQYFA